MMEIAGAVEDKRRQFFPRFAIKFFDQPRGRGEPKLRAPGRNIPRPERERAGGPGIIQVEMNRLAQDSNVVAERTQATAHFQEPRAGIRKLRRRAEGAKEEVVELKGAASS